MNTLLGNISSNLNQITRRINSTNAVYQKDLDDIKELMEKIWQLQKSMVSKQPLITQ
nr:plasmid mobilization relaxosome protein MobC [Blautia obeum]